LSWKACPCCDIEQVIYVSIPQRPVPVVEPRSDWALYWEENSNSSNIKEPRCTLVLSLLCWTMRLGSKTILSAFIKIANFKTNFVFNWLQMHLMRRSS